MKQHFERKQSQPRLANHLAGFNRTVSLCGVWIGSDAFIEGRDPAFTRKRIKAYVPADGTARPTEEGECHSEDLLCDCPICQREGYRAGRVADLMATGISFAEADKIVRKERCPEMKQHFERKQITPRRVNHLTQCNRGESLCGVWLSREPFVEGCDPSFERKPICKRCANVARQIIAELEAQLEGEGV